MKKNIIQNKNNIFIKQIVMHFNNEFIFFTESCLKC